MRHLKHILQWSLIPAWLVTVGAVGYDTYLLEGRQAITWEVPDVTPIGWHCGRSVEPRHCAAVTPIEDEIWADFRSCDDLLFASNRVIELGVFSAIGNHRS